MNYDYVTDCANDFLEWVKDMNSLKALSEASTESTLTAAAENTATIFPGVSATFTPTLHVEPRNYYFTADSEKIFVTHKAWHRDTSINFSILPVHSFSDGYDYYVFKVTGNTDTSKQYAHLSYMGSLFSENLIIEGMTKDKDGKLLCDNILGYNYKFQYTAQLMSGKTPVGVVLVSAPDTNNNSTKVNKGFKFTLDGGITGGLSAKDSLKGDISIKPKWEWESKEEYTVTDYWLEDVPLAWRSSVNLKSEFVIKVTKEQWKKYPSLKLVKEFKSSEGATEGGGAFLFIGNAGRSDSGKIQLQGHISKGRHSSSNASVQKQIMISSGW